jgi:hypothetical protein
MPNVLVVPVSGAIFFDRNAAGASTVAALNSAVRLNYDNGGGLNITSYTTALTALDRFTVDGAQGRLFSVSDALTGSLMSVNDITGLPILEVLDTDTVVAGTFNTNTFIVSGTRIAVGRTIDSTAKVAISGNTTMSGTLSTNNIITALGGNSNQWNSNFSTTQSNSANWTDVYTTVKNFSASWEETADIGAVADRVTNIQQITGSWQRTYTNVSTNSALWSQGASAASYTLTAQNFIITGTSSWAVNTATSRVSGTLPASPSTGTTIRFLDDQKTWASNNFVIIRNGQPIESVAENLNCDISGYSFSLTYVGGGIGWRLY